MIVTTREQRRQLARDNAKMPRCLAPVEGWKNSPNVPQGVIEVWRSRDFLVQVYSEGAGIVRASVNRTSVNTSNGRWTDSISWDELQQIKREIGRGHLDAVEVFPADCDIVNIANMRHLFIFDQQLPYAWRNNRIAKDRP